MQQPSNPYHQQPGTPRGRSSGNDFGLLAMRMAMVMVSVMIVAAALLYYREQSLLPGESEAKNPSPSQKASRAATIAKAADIAQPSRAAATAKAMDPAKPSGSASAAKQTAQPAKAGKSAENTGDLPEMFKVASAAGQTQEEQSVKAPASDAKKEAGDAKEEEKGDTPASTAGQDGKQTSQTGAAQPAAPADPQKEAAYRRGVAGARLAMSKRDPIGAKLQLKAVAELAQTPEEEAEVARLDTLIGNLREFWKTMAQVTAGLQPAQEFTMNGGPVIVVEGGATQVTLRVDGRNQTYAVKSLPRPLVDVLVQASFADNAANKVLYGTFLAYDPQGDRKLARKVWQQAINAGQQIKPLLAELDAAPSGGKSGAGRGPITKTDPPTDPMALQKGESEVRALFEADYNAASSVPGKLKLAEKLAEAIATADVTAEGRFVMLRDARDNALAAGHPALACQVIDQFGIYFTVDPLEMKISAVEQTARSARTSKSAKDLAECALGLVDQAIEGGRTDHAGRLAAIAVSAAQKAKSPALLRDAQEAKQKVEEAAGKDATDTGKKKGK